MHWTWDQVLVASAFWLLQVVHAAPSAPPATQQDFKQRNFNTIQSIYNLTVYPNNLPVVRKGASAVPKGLFADNVLGRVSPVGNFTTFEDSIEYFFGLAPVPSEIPTGIGFYAADLSHFSSECPGIAASVVQLRTAVLDPTTGAIKPGSVRTPLKQVGFWKFNDKGEVSAYEAWIPNLQLWTEYANGVNFSNPFIQNAVPTQLCPTIQQRCTGKHQQYNDVPTCVSTLQGKPFGSFDQAWDDTVSCRNIHLALTIVRPEIHCPHVGPRGGEGPKNFKCVKADYNREYANDQELFGSATPFKCGT